jgi:hypothetical protein
LETAKWFTDAKLLASRRNWPDAVLGMTANGQTDFPIDFIWTYPKPAPTAADMELWKVIKELQRVVESLKIQATPPLKRPGNDKTVTWGESERIYRTNSGVLRYYCCSGAGHMARNCWENPQSPSFRQQQYSGPPGQSRGASGPTAPINIVSQLAKTTATISVNHKMGTATGEAVVFRMDGIDLILGNDFLKQYGKVQIDYREQKASITFGDQPLAAITSQPIDHQPRSVKLVITTDVTVPSFSVPNVGTVAPSLQAESFCFEPSGKLLQNKGVSVGLALLSAKVNFVPLANFAATICIF